MLFHIRKLILFLLAFQAKQAADDKNFKPLQELTGADTLIERQMAGMVTKDSDWQAMWREHKQIIGDLSNSAFVSADAPPKIDFKNNVVLVYFAGQTKGIDGYEIVKVETKGKTDIVRIAPHFFPDSTILSNTYGMWIFPIPKKTVELQLLVDVINGQQQYRKVGEFQPPKVTQGKGAAQGSGSGQSG